MKVVSIFVALCLVFATVSAQTFTFNTPSLLETNDVGMTLPRTAADGDNSQFKVSLTHSGPVALVSNFPFTQINGVNLMTGDTGILGIFGTEESNIASGVVVVTTQNFPSELASKQGGYFRFTFPQGFFTDANGDVNAEFDVDVYYSGAQPTATIVSSTVASYGSDNVDTSLNTYTYTFSQAIKDVTGATFSIGESGGETAVTITNDAAFTLSNDGFTVTVDAGDYTLGYSTTYDFIFSGSTNYFNQVIDANTVSLTTYSQFHPANCPLETFWQYNVAGTCDCEGPQDSLASATIPIALVASETSLNSNVMKITYDEPMFYQVQDADAERVGLQPKITFVNNDRTVTSNAACLALFSWSYTEDTTCVDYVDDTTNVPMRRWVGTANAQQFYSNCPYSEFNNQDPPPGGAASADWTYTTINLEVTNYQPFRLETDRDPAEFYGPIRERTVTHAVAYNIYFQESATVSVSTVDVFSNVAAVRAIVKQAVSSTQIASSDEAKADLEVFFQTSYPFALTVTDSTIAETTSRGFTFTQWSEADSNSDYVCQQPSAASNDDDDSSIQCQQVFKFQMQTVPGEAHCDFDSTLLATLKVICVPGYDGVCPVENETVKVAFTIDSSNHCPQVADTVILQEEFFTYSTYTAGTTPDDANKKTNFLAGQDAYYVVNVWSDQVGLASASLNSVSISGSTLGSPIELINPSGAATIADDAVIHVESDETGKAAGQALHPWFRVKVNPTNSGDYALNVARRSSSTFTVSGIVAVTYQTTFTQGYSELRPFSYEMKTQGFQSNNSPIAASATFSGDAEESTDEETSDSGDLLQNQSAITAGVGVVGLIAMAVAFFAMKKNNAASEAKLKESSSSSNMMLQMTNTNSDNSRSESAEGTASV